MSPSMVFRQDMGVAALLYCNTQGKFYTDLLRSKVKPEKYHGIFELLTCEQHHIFGKKIDKWSIIKFPIGRNQLPLLACHRRPNTL